MVRRTKQPVYPVGIFGSDEAMPRSAWFIRPARTYIVYGPRFTEAEFLQLQTGNDAAFCELARQRVADCVAKAALSGKPAFCDNTGSEKRSIE